MAEALNTFLADPKLFAEERFSNYWLNSATRSLRELHTSSAIPGYSSGGPLTDHDLEHFNRLLLEDAFPHSLKKIHRIRLDAIYKCIHEKKPAALCFSGGGIRSGTFALGILQGLARHDLLSKFHFLSTVSGGGYIGSWLAAWIHRHPAGLSGVTTDLANQTPLSKVDPDPDPIRFLRRYSSFITPKVGLLSADTWTFVAIYLRNLLLNWMVFIPLLLSVLTLPRFIVSITTTESHPKAWELGPLNILQPSLFTCRRFPVRGVGAGLHHVQSTNTKRRIAAGESVLASQNIAKLVSHPVFVTTLDRGVLFDDLLVLVESEWRTP